MTGGFLTLKEVTERLRISKSTVSRLVNTRQINHCRFGSRVLFLPEWVDEYIVRSTVMAKEEGEEGNQSS